jgi:hypothetical protein
MYDNRSSSMCVSWWARSNGDEHASDISVWWLNVATTNELFDELLLWLWLEWTDICCCKPLALFVDLFVVESHSSLLFEFNFSKCSSYFSSACNFDRRFCKICDTSVRRLGLIWIDVWVISLICDINRSSRKSYGNVSTHSASNCIRYCEKRLNFGLLWASFCYKNKQQLLSLTP